MEIVSELQSIIQEICRFCLYLRVLNKINAIFGTGFESNIL